MKGHRTMFTEINFSPYAENIIDYVDNPNLSTPDGTKVRIHMFNLHFSIHIGDTVHEISDNLAASYLLNINQVGVNR